MQFVEKVADVVAHGAFAQEKLGGYLLVAQPRSDGFHYLTLFIADAVGGEVEFFLAGHKLGKSADYFFTENALSACNSFKRGGYALEILFEHNTLGLFGENGVEGAHLVKRKGEPDEELVDIQIDGFFLAIGHKPNTDIFREWLETDEVGYLKKIDGTPKTKIPGVFVAGDCADPVYRQAISAAGSGCQAAIEAERYLLNA